MDGKIGGPLSLSAPPFAGDIVLDESLPPIFFPIGKEAAPDSSRSDQVQPFWHLGQAMFLLEGFSLVVESKPKGRDPISRYFARTLVYSVLNHGILFSHLFAWL